VRLLRQASATKSAVYHREDGSRRDRDYNDANYLNYSYRNGRGIRVIQRGNRYLTDNAGAPSPTKAA